MKTAEEIVNNLHEEMPYSLHNAINPYIIEAMKIYANQKLDEAILALKEDDGVHHEYSVINKLKDEL